MGIIGGLMLMIALIRGLSIGVDDIVAGVCSKVGLVLLAIVLAWPSVEKLIDKAPAIVYGGLGLVLLLAAIRPKLFPLILGGVVLTLAVHFGLRFASKKLDNQ